jgi:hypothetical protein
MLAVPHTIPERLGWPADLSELQIQCCVAQRRVITVNRQPKRSNAPANARVQTPRGRRAPNASNTKNHERYMALANEAAARGDAIEAANLYQHAEHYFRQMREKSP